MKPKGSQSEPIILQRYPLRNRIEKGEKCENPVTRGGPIHCTFLDVSGADTKTSKKEKKTERAKKTMSNPHSVY
jgi:hypothetical protein